MAESERLSDEEIHDVLSNTRRRRVLELLRETDGGITARDLSERIAEMESGESPPPRKKRQSVYVSLHQTHLPKLDDLEIVHYDSQAKEVSLQDGFKEVANYLTTGSGYEIPPSGFYLVIGMAGLVTVYGAMHGIPGLSALAPHVWASLFLFSIVLKALYQTYQQDHSLIDRVRSEY